MEAQDNRAGYKSSGPTEGSKHKTIQKGRGRGYIRRARGGVHKRWGRGCSRRGGGGAGGIDEGEGEGGGADR